MKKLLALLLFPFMVSADNADDIKECNRDAHCIVFNKKSEVYEDYDTPQGMEVYVNQMCVNKQVIYMVVHDGNKAQIVSSGDFTWCVIKESI